MGHARGGEEKGGGISTSEKERRGVLEKDFTSSRERKRIF